MSEKPKVRNKPTVHLTRAVKDFIIDKMCSGIDISNICKKFKDKVPAYETIIRSQAKDSEWAKEVDQAYTVLLMRRLDELEEVASETWCKDRLELFGGDYKMAFEARRAKLDSLKFVLGKMAPILSVRFNKTEKLEVTGIPESKMAVINYYATPTPIPVQLSGHSDIIELSDER